METAQRIKSRGPTKLPEYGSLEAIVAAFNQGAGVYSRADVAILLRVLGSKLMGAE